MAYEYISITSSVFVVIGYLPEIYFVFINKKSNITNIPIWIIWLLSSGLGIIYCGLNQNYLIMINYFLNFFLCLVTFSLNMFFLYYCRIEKMYINEMNVYEINVDEIYIDEINVDEINVDEMNIDEINKICDNV